jgi:catechol 2,3-dioxygenase-like lactoylglutathione lyase family enzyme
MSNEVRFNHLGHTVADIGRARRFYEELLGFRFWWDFEVPDELSSRVLMVPPPVGLTATYLWRPDLALNLMHFGDARAKRAYRERYLNEPGYTHIALSVEDAAREHGAALALGHGGLHPRPGRSAHRDRHHGLAPGDAAPARGLRPRPDTRVDSVSR